MTQVNRLGLCWMLVLLTGCADGCNPQLALPADPPNDRVPAANKAVVKAVPEATSAYGVALPLREGPVGRLVAATAPSRRFAPNDLNKRFWLLLGPKGLILNEREVLPAGPLPAGDVQAVVQSGLVDWRNRSGVEAKSALLLLDAAVDPDTARQVVREVRLAKPMEVSMLFRTGTDTTDEAIEVSLPHNFGSAPAR